MPVICLLFYLQTFYSSFFEINNNKLLESLIKKNQEVY